MVVGADVKLTHCAQVRATHVFRSACACSLGWVSKRHCVTKAAAASMRSGRATTRLAAENARARRDSFSHLQRGEVLGRF